MVVPTWNGAQITWMVIAIPSRRMTILGRKEETTEYPTVVICYWAFPDTVPKQQGENLHESRQNELNCNKLTQTSNEIIP